MLSDDDTILFGAIPCSEDDADGDIAELKSELNLPDGWIRYDSENERIEMPLTVAEEIADLLSVPVQMVEIHPTFDRMEVGLVNLNNHR